MTGSRFFSAFFQTLPCELQQTGISAGAVALRASVLSHLGFDDVPEVCLFIIQ